MTLETLIPLRVAIFDDDYYALKWNTALVMRDPRSTVVIETQKASDLIQQMGEGDPIDIVVLDAEYNDEQWSLPQLLNKIKSQFQTKIICLSQYGNKQVLQNAFENGADSFLLKDDIQMSIVPALMKCKVIDHVISPSIEKILKGNLSELLVEYSVIPKWIPNPEMTPQILTAFWMRVFFGMRSPIAAEEMGVANGTVDRYVNLAYGILPNNLGDEEYLFGLDLDKYSAEDRAFVLFTLPPTK